VVSKDAIRVPARITGIYLVQPFRAGPTRTQAPRLLKAADRPSLFGHFSIRKSVIEGQAANIARLKACVLSAQGCCLSKSSQSPPT